MWVGSPTFMGNTGRCDSAFAYACTADDLNQTTNERFAGTSLFSKKPRGG